MKKIISLFLILFLLIFPIRVFAYENDEITLYFFHGDGCPHCADEEEFLESIEGKYSNLKIVKYEVWYDKENASLLSEVSGKLYNGRVGVPFNVIGSTVISGFGSGSGSKLERAIEYYQKNEYKDVVSEIIEGTYTPNEDIDNDDDDEIQDEFSRLEEESDEALTISVPIIGKVNLKKVSLTTAAVVIGLIDGFNPCAMWILLFLISTLIGMKDRRRMIILGMTFLITSALVYMLIMLSWINIVVSMTTVIWLRNIIAVVALIGGILNIRSFIKSNKNDGCNVVDESKRKKIFSKIKKFTKEKSFLIAMGGMILLAISVNVVELACSAGLPIVFTEILALNNVNDTMKFMYTLLYIFFFLIDDLIVFFIAVFTMKTIGISTKYNKYSHLLGGLIMVIVGILLIFKPGWLMFNFK